MILRKKGWPFKFRDDRALNSSKKNLFYFVTFLMLCFHLNLIYINWLHHCYVIRDFKGPEVWNFDLKYLKMEKKFQKRYWTKNILNFGLMICNHIYFAIQSLKNDYLSRLQESSFPDISKTVHNILTVVEQNVFQITKTFFWHHEKVLQN